MAATHDHSMLCCYCGNDEYELFSQTEMDNGQLIICFCCDQQVNADMWQERLVAKINSKSNSDKLREQLMASAKEFLGEVKGEEVLPICFKIPCHNCRGMEFRNVEDEEGMSTLAHVKVCTHCHHVVGVDDNVLLEEIKDLLSNAAFKTSECQECGNTDPDQYRFEGDDGAVVIRCMRCSLPVEASYNDLEKPGQIETQLADCDEPEPRFHTPSGPTPAMADSAAGASSLINAISLGSTLLDRFTTTTRVGETLGLKSLISVDMCSLARNVNNLKRANIAGQIPHCTLVDGVVEEVGKTATRWLAAGICCFLPVPVTIGRTIGFCLGQIMAPAGGRACVWAYDKAPSMIKTLRG